MKIWSLFFCLFPFLYSFGQNIFFSRDSVGISNQKFIDSVVVHNNGTAVLRIDSIKCKNLNYAFNFSEGDRTEEWYWLESFTEPERIIEIKQNDSLKIYLSIAMMLCKQKNADYLQVDTLYFYNNSMNSPIQPLVVHNKVVMGAVEDENIPHGFSLFQNYPNPFNPSTTIEYTIPASLNPSKGGTYVKLSVYDILGREVVTLVNESKPAGSYSLTFNVETLHGASLPSGIYFYQLRAGNYSETKKMMLMK